MTRMQVPNTDVSICGAERDPSGRCVTCRDRTSEARLLRDRLVSEQGGCCAICRRSFEAIGKPPCLDHDHRTGVARGALCPGCNMGIGLLQDDPEIVESAGAYLRRHASGGGQ